MRTRTRIIAAAAAALAPITVAAVVAVATRGTDGRPAATGPRVQAGTNFDARRTVTETDHRSFVALPTGRVELGVDDPTDRWVYDERGVYGEDGTARPPRGGSFVLVAWSVEPDYQQVISGESSYTDAPDGFESLVLVAGGKRHPLATLPADEYGGSTVVAVDGDGDDARIEVGYDGVVQSVDAGTGARTPGRAGPLYGRTLLGSGSCGTATPAAPFSAVTGTDFACDYRVRRTAYVTGPGWAPAGRQWLVVEIGYSYSGMVRLTRDGRAADWSVRHSRPLTATLNATVGTPARTQFEPNDYHRALYFSVPVGSDLPPTLTVTQPFSVEQAADDDADNTELLLSRQLPLR